MNLELFLASGFSWLLFWEEGRRSSSAAILPWNLRAQGEQALELWLQGMFLTLSAHVYLELVPLMDGRDWFSWLLLPWAWLLARTRPGGRFLFLITAGLCYLVFSHFRLEGLSRMLAELTHAVVLIVVSKMIIVGLHRRLQFSNAPKSIQGLPALLVLYAFLTLVLESLP